MNNIVIGLKQDGSLVSSSSDSINRHCFALGKSGCGKSTNLLTQVVEIAEQGEPVIVINWRNSANHELLMPELRKRYERLVKVIDVGKNGIGLPLFTPQKDDAGEDEPPQNLVRRITALLKVSCNLTPTQERYTYQAVQTVYEQELYPREGIAAVSHFLKVQDRAVASNAAAKIGCICDRNLIRTGDFWENQTRIYEFDLNSLEYDDQLPVCRFLTDYILRLAGRGAFMKKGLTLFVDECQNLDFSEGSTMFAMLNETRKLNIHVLLAAPSILSKSGMDVIRQCGFGLYFEPLENERKKVAESIDALHLEKWIFLLSRLKRGDFIACGNFAVGNEQVPGPIQLRSVPLHGEGGVDA